MGDYEGVILDSKWCCITSEGTQTLGIHGGTLVTKMEGRGILFVLWGSGREFTRDICLMQKITHAAIFAWYAIIASDNSWRALIR